MRTPPRPSGNPAVATPKEQHAVPPQSKNTRFLQELFIETDIRHGYYLAQLPSVSLEGSFGPGGWLRAALLDLPHDRACRLEHTILGSWERIETDREPAAS